MKDASWIFLAVSIVVLIGVIAFQVLDLLHYI